MAKSIQKMQALELRRNGKSIKDIAKRLSVSKGSVSLWCRDIVLSDEQKEHLYREAKVKNLKGRLLGAEMNKEKKKQAIEDSKKWAKRILNTFSKRDLLIAGIALYWAEGSKKNSSGLVLVNSDPEMIRFMHNWMVKIMGVKKEDIHPRLSINESHRHRIRKVLRYWSDLLNIPIKNFGNPWYVKVKHKKIYENHDDYYGVLRLGVRKSGILKYKMLSLIEILGGFK